MPLQILPYNEIYSTGSKSKSPIWDSLYTRFSDEVASILQKNALAQNIFECEYMANMKKTQKLLGPEFVVESIPLGRVFPRKILKEKIGRVHRTCVIQGVNRYLVIGEKNISK